MISLSPLQLVDGQVIKLYSPKNTHQSIIKMTTEGLVIGKESSNTLIEGSLAVSDKVTAHKGVEFGGGFIIKHNPITDSLDITGVE